MSKAFIAARSSLVALAAAAAIALVPVHAHADAPAIKDVLTNYSNIAEAGYGDSLKAARDLKSAVDALIKTPTDATLDAARKAWIAARVPYMQTEAFRFGNPVVDDWEGRVNAWPLDEGLIDYVAEAYGTENPENEYYAANVIANKSLKVAGKTVDTSKITPELLRGLNEAGGVKANVATGYHAIEFLLWGQDLNGTGPGAGNRPATDYDLKACTHDNCDRRAQYLSTVTDMLVDDLAYMTEQWGPKGEARAFIMKDDKSGLTAIFTGLGSLSYGELAGERMKLGLIIHDPEEEHDCFSDNTHNSHYGDAHGIQNVYLGTYKRLDGSTVSGPSVSDLVKAKSPEADARVRAAIDKTVGKMTALVDRANKVEAYDQMIGLDNPEGNAVVQAAIDALIAQAKEFERAVAALDLKDIKFEGSDSLDAPDKVGGNK
ncbi:imelysin family protein [Hyphomicrobium sp.]|uniref:imelysin family protein n=1 Tax=Hyphomicrobium sp. TaxID=82 RepID=UPI002E36FD4D|nr:imelysin family protein [Hyphomicrobium sp.]HEX2840088.1 imelysin family protein [Hyphomicrobium sp.]